ncbi:MAG TPA: DUF2520 domain-containing protein [Polyangiaceae bacterium]
MRIHVQGAGKVGVALARALKRSGAEVTLRSARKGLPRTIDADLVVLAVRDRDLGPLAEAMRGVVTERAAVVHVAGALDAQVLAPLRGACAGVGQMHPMISFASKRFTPTLARGNLHVQGDRAAVARARRVARLLGMTARTIPGLDTIAYHAAAGLVANGAAALAAVGAELLARANVPEAVAPRMLGPLLRSVAENVEAMGFPGALTGPVRRGDARGVDRHLGVLAKKLPAAVPLYLASAEAQLPLARALGDATPQALDEVAAVLRASHERPAPTK